MLTNTILAEAEDVHYKFQLGCYFSGSKKIKGALILWSDKIKDFYWNFATKIDTTIADFPILIKTLSSFYQNKGRQTTVYITPFTKPRNLKKFLDVKPNFRDAWMFYKGSKPKFLLPDNFVIKKVENKEEMTVFISIFNQSYGGATADEPYGALPKGYAEMLLKSKKFNHYIGYLDNQPVVIGSLIYSKGFAGLYNLGVSPNHRKKGFGKLMLLYRVKEAIKRKNKVIFLQTEKDSINEKLFAKFGFKTEFIGEGFLIKIPF